MTSTFPKFLISSSLLFTAALLPLQAQELPDGPGKETVNKVCAGCHGLDVVTGMKRTKAEWEMTVNNMAANGASATAEEFSAIVAYLAKNFGKEDAPAGPAPSFPEGEGRVLIMRSCGTCHSTDQIARQRKSEAQWQATVVRMSTRGAVATTAELDTITKYLFQNFGAAEDTSKINVNKATAKDIETLGFTTKEAEIIVDYRNRHGDFREWGDLLQLYGVDGRKAEAAKDKMSF